MTNLRVVLKTETREKAQEISDEILDDAARFGMLELEDIDILPTENGMWEASFYVHNWEIFRKIAEKSKERAGQAYRGVKGYTEPEERIKSPWMEEEVVVRPSVEHKGAFRTVGSGLSFGYEGLKSGISSIPGRTRSAAGFVREKTPDRAKGVASGIYSSVGDKALQYGVSGIGLTGEKRREYEQKRREKLSDIASERIDVAKEKVARETSDIGAKYGSLENAFRTEYNRIIRAMRESDTADIDIQILRDFVNQSKIHGVDSILIKQMQQFRNQLENRESAGVRIAEAGVGAGMRIAEGVTRLTTQGARERLADSGYSGGGVGGIDPTAQSRGIGGITRGFETEATPYSTRSMFGIPGRMGGEPRRVMGNAFPTGLKEMNVRNVMGI